MNQDMHDVNVIEIRSVMTNQSTTGQKLPFYTRKIVIRTTRNEVLEITLFSDIQNDLTVNHFHGES